MSVPVFQDLTSAPQIQYTDRREQIIKCDSTGHFSVWDVRYYSEELFYNGCCFRKDFSQSVLVERRVQRPPLALQRPSAVPIITAPPASQTAQALSVLLSPVFRPLILALPLVIYRAGSGDNPVIRIIDRVVQLLTIPGNSREASCSEESKQKTPDKLSGAEGIKPNLTHSKLVALLSEAIRNQGQALEPDNIQKALLYFLNTENRLHQVEGENVSFNRDLTSADGFSQNTATENSGVLAQEKLNSAVIRVFQNSTPDIKVGSEGLAKALTDSGSAVREQGRGERASKAGSGSEAVRPDTGNKVNINNSTIPVIPNQGGSVLSPLSQVLASNLPAAMQPPAVVETGQKQLPPIILPNVNPGAGNRSERRKSRKELEEEEEKEREGLSWLFDDEDPFDEPLDSE
ncbi:hypothetical protein [Endozoicomonas sp.]|uniref:hypothetical protein n=1 Tax=Endozoicomonas sp. TaxID=1892382 RepID=UPI00383B4E40